MATADVDNDGFTDLLVGTPYEDVGSQTDAEAGDRFGEAITLGLLAGTSNRVDAAVGIPSEDVGSISNAGAISTIDDLYTGAVAGQIFDQETTGVPGAAENGDSFGQVVDSVRAGSTTHLAVGVASEDAGSVADTGSVQLFSSNGVTVTPGVGLSQDTTNVTDTSEAGDRFGRQLVLAPPGLGDTKTRLAVSSPYEDGPATDTGQVQIFPLDDLGAEVTYDQDSTGMVGSAAANDQFGGGLGFVAGVGERAFLVGVPNDVEFPGGMVNVIPLTGGSMRSWRPGAGTSLSLGRTGSAPPRAGRYSSSARSPFQSLKVLITSRHVLGLRLVQVRRCETWCRAVT